jgi:hypothetical protein
MECGVKKRTKFFGDACLCGDKKIHDGGEVLRPFFNFFKLSLSVCTVALLKYALL